MGKKASLSETKRTQIVILHKEGLSERKIRKKKWLVAKRLFIKRLLDFKITDFTMTRKEVEGKEKQTLTVSRWKLDSANCCSFSNQFLLENTLDSAS